MIKTLLKIWSFLSTMKKKVITYDAFGLLHWNHIKLLERAKELADYLMVAISTDEFNSQNKKPIIVINIGS